jgi:hypothetical protein
MMAISTVFAALGRQPFPLRGNQAFGGGGAPRPVAHVAAVPTAPEPILSSPRRPRPARGIAVGGGGLGRVGRQRPGLGVRRGPTTPLCGAVCSRVRTQVAMIRGGHPQRIY